MIGRITITLFILISIIVILYFSFCNSVVYKAAEVQSSIKQKPKKTNMVSTNIGHGHIGNGHGHGHGHIGHGHGHIGYGHGHDHIGYGHGHGQPTGYVEHSDYLPDSLYTRPCKCTNSIEFGNLNLEPYIERIMEVNDLIDRENINDLRDL